MRVQLAAAIVALSLSASSVPSLSALVAHTECATLHHSCAGPVFAGPCCCHTISGDLPAALWLVSTLTSIPQVVPAFPGEREHPTAAVQLRVPEFTPRLVLMELPTLYSVLLL